jgi:hypothetical protein
MLQISKLNWLLLICLLLFVMLVGLRDFSLMLPEMPSWIRSLKSQRTIWRALLVS